MPTSDSQLKGAILPSTGKALKYLNSAETLKTLLEFIPDAVIAHHNNTIIYCNPAAIELFRADSEEALVGMDRDIIVHPDELPLIAKRQTDAINNKILGGNKTRRHIRLDGTEFYSRNSFIRFGPTDYSIFLVIFRDETSSIETRNALEFEENQFRSSFEDAHIGMAIMEIDGKFRHVNKAFCDKLNYSREELTSRYAFDITFQEDMEITRKNIQLLLDGDKSASHIEKRYISKDNRIVWFSLNAALVKTPEGDPSHILVQVEDISDRKAVEAELKKYQLGLTRLHEIALDQKLTRNRKIEKVIRLGTELFELPVGMMGHASDNLYTVEMAVGPGSRSLKGAEIAYEDSYCIMTIEADKPLGFHNVSRSPIAGNSCYEKLRFEAYFGAPIHVSGKTYGTLCYVSNSSRKKPFSEYEESLIQLFAEWIGNELMYAGIEKALRDNADKYHAVTENAGDAIFVHKRNGKFIEVNEAACKSLGYSRSDLLSMGTDDIEVGMDEETIARNRVNFTKDGSFITEGIHKRKDGSTFPVEIRVSKIEIGGLDCSVAIARDLSERIQNEEALKESEEKFRRLYEYTGVGMIIMKLDGDIIDLNDAYCNILGYGRKELVGKNIQIVVHPDDREETQNALDTTEEGTEVDKLLQHKDGHTVWCKLNRTVVRNSKGEVIYRLGQIRDITKQKLAELALAERLDLQALMQNSAIAVNEAITAEEAILECLTRVCEFIDWPLGHAFIRDENNPQKLNSSGIWYLGGNGDYTEIRSFTENRGLTAGQGVPGLVLAEKQAIWNNIRTAPTYKPRSKLLLKSGLKVSITAPIKVGNDVVGILEFFTDEDVPENSTYVTMISQIGTQLGRAIERDRAQKKLIEAKLTAESGNRVKTEFLANMSHELRSPLTAILGFTETMQAEIFGPIGNDKYREYLDNISNSAEHLHAIINDVLDVSAIETGNLVLNEEICEISSLGQGAVRMISNRAEEKKLHIVNRFIDSDIRIVVDERRMKQIFVNILSNAVRFTSADGKVTMEPNITESGWLELSFIDTGIGMDEEGIKKALSKFGQVDSTLAREFEGTGLGLPLTKEMTEAHDGELKIVSEIGVGTKIVICLPPGRIVS